MSALLLLGIPLGYIGFLGLAYYTADPEPENSVVDEFSTVRSERRSS